MRERPDRRKKLSTIQRQNKKEILKNAQPAVNVNRGDILRGKVYNTTEDGAFIVTEENHIGFVHVKEQTQTLKEGMTVEGRVTFIRPDGRVNLSLRPQKEYAMVADAEKVIEYLKKRNGSMPFNDNSPPEVVMEKFGISKGAFKRALGKLYRDRRIEMTDGWVTLVGEDEI